MYRAQHIKKGLYYNVQSKKIRFQVLLFVSYADKVNFDIYGVAIVTCGKPPITPKPPMGFMGTFS